MEGRSPSGSKYLTVKTNGVEVSPLPGETWGSERFGSLFVSRTVMVTVAVSSPRSVQAR
jgi:hypothetical protein